VHFSVCACVVLSLVKVPSTMIVFCVVVRVLLVFWVVARVLLVFWVVARVLLEGSMWLM